jgi:endonuclease-3
MTKSARIAFLLRELQSRYPDPPVPLDHQDPYTLLVAVLLSAQCTDERVNLVTPHLWALADNPVAMARQEEAKILEIVRPCGLGPQKAKAIKRLSEILVAEHGGKVPANLETLETLPGVGHKTAQVVMAQAFGEPSFPVDTHIHRLAQRWGLTNGRSVAQTEKDLKRLFPRESWNALHLQIIFFGREHCHARKVCDGGPNACPFCPALNPGRKRARKTKKA